MYGCAANMTLIATPSGAASVVASSGDAVSAARQARPDEGYHDRGHGFRLGPIADVLARKCRLVHGCPHVAWVKAVPGEVRLLCRPGQRLVIKSGLAGSIAAPALIVIDTGI